MWNKKEHGKTTSVMTSQVDQKGETDLEGLSKSQTKNLAKISAQTAQIKDLRVKLDSAVAENTQMHEYLDPKNFQTHITNVIQEAQRTASQINQFNQRYIPHQSHPYTGIPQPPECSAGKDGTTNPELSCRYCKDTGHKLPNCLRLEKKKDLEATRAASRPQNSSNWTHLLLGVAREGTLRWWDPQKLQLK